jgi:hypothetical protein
MRSPNRPPLSKRMVLVAGVAGTFVLGSAGVAFANTHDSSGVRIAAQRSVESSTSVGSTTSVENPTAPALETRTFATRGGTVVVEIDHANHHVTLVSATAASGWTVKTNSNNGRGKRVVDVRFRTLTATDPSVTTITGDSNSLRKADDHGPSAGTEIRVRVSFAAWRLLEFVSSRTFGPREPSESTSTTTETTSPETASSVDDANDDANDDDGKDDSSDHAHQGRGHDDPKTDDHGGRGGNNDDQGDDDGAQRDDHGGDRKGNGGNGNARGKANDGGNKGNGNHGGDDHGGKRGGNGGNGGDDHGGRHG